MCLFPTTISNCARHCGKGIRKDEPRYTMPSRCRCINSSMGRQDKKTLVVISDGGDNDSTHTLAEVMQRCAVVACHHLYGGYLR